jgi:choline kinase
MQETIVIPAAGQGKRMKSYGPKALIELRNNQNVLTRQINIFQTFMPNNPIVIIAGFEADKIRRAALKFKNVEVVVNRHYEKTNVAYSIALGLQKVAGAAMIVYGDLVFNKETICHIPVGESVAVVDSRKQIRDIEVGLNIVADKITHFSYGLSTKWAQIIVLQKEECEIFKREATAPARHSYFGFEILNKVIDAGYPIRCVEPDPMRIVEIDTSKDIDDARKIV